MGGQACVFYGAAQFSKDVNLLFLVEEANFRNLLSALSSLNAQPIALPLFNPELLARGHAIYFRCATGVAAGIRIDVMTKFRDLLDSELLWERRTTISDEEANKLHLLSLLDLVRAKKTQRSKDSLVIEALIAIHMLEKVYGSLGCSRIRRCRVHQCRGRHA